MKFILTLENIETENLVIELSKLFFEKALDKYERYGDYRETSVIGRDLNSDNEKIKQILDNNLILFRFEENLKVDGKLVNAVHHYDKTNDFHTIKVNPMDNPYIRFPKAVHEFRHLYDHIISNGKAIKYGSSTVGGDEYYNLSQEISAKYTEVISYLLENNLIGRFEIALHNFKEKIRFDKIKSPKDKKRLLNRFYKHWDELNKNRERNKKLETKFNDFYKQIKDKDNILSYCPYLNQITIEKSNKKSLIEKFAKKNDIYIL